VAEPIPIVRDARPDEAAALSDLAFRSKAHWGYDDAFMEACRDELRVARADIETGGVLVAETDRAIVGFAALSGDPPDAELEAMFVDPGVIRTGTGTRLLAAALERARARGYRRLLIESDPNATGFYEHQGATRIGDRESASIPGRRLPLLALDL
jgi:GNAT superfamily N-acetyltransferase